MERELPDEVLIGLNRDNPQLHDVYRLDLVTGELTKEVENPGFIGWVADAQLVVRGAAGPAPDGGFELMVRDSADADWRLLLVDPGRGRAHHRRGRVQRRRAVAADHQLGRRADRPAGRASTWPPARRRCWPRTPEADVSGVRVHPDTREPQIVTVLKARSEYLVLDPSVADDLAAIQALHPGDPSLRQAPTTPTTSGWWASPTTPGRSPTTPTTGRPRSAKFLFETPARAVAVRAGPDGAVLVHRAGRPDGARLPHASRPATERSSCRPC